VNEGPPVGIPDKLGAVLELCARRCDTRASHMFSLTVVLYEMLIGAQAFAGQDVLELFQEIRNVQPHRCAAEVPEPFAGILRGALTREAEEAVDDGEDGGGAGGGREIVTMAVRRGTGEGAIALRTPVCRTGASWPN
jgi:hypothetical protein